MNKKLSRFLELIITILFLFLAAYVIRVINELYFGLGNYIYSIWAVISFYIIATPINKLLKEYQ
jgi:hypothetical protein